MVKLNSATAGGGGWGGAEVHVFQCNPADGRSKSAPVDSDVFCPGLLSLLTWSVGLHGETGAHPGGLPGPEGAAGSGSTAACAQTRPAQHRRSAHARGSCPIQSGGSTRVQTSASPTCKPMIDYCCGFDGTGERVHGATDQRRPQRGRRQQSDGRLQPSEPRLTEKGPTRVPVFS